MQGRCEVRPGWVGYSEDALVKSGEVRSTALRLGVVAP